MRVCILSPNALLCGVGRAQTRVLGGRSIFLCTTTSLLTKLLQSLEDPVQVANQGIRGGLCLFAWGDPIKN